MGVRREVLWIGVLNLRISDGGEERNVVDWCS